LIRTQQGERRHLPPVVVPLGKVVEEIADRRDAQLLKRLRPPGADSFHELDRRLETLGFRSSDFGFREAHAGGADGDALPSAPSGFGMSWSALSVARILSRGISW